MTDKSQNNQIKYRIFRCGKSDFCKEEILNADKNHSEKQLKAIAKAGFNGIWLRGKLRELSPGNLFEPFVKNVPQRLVSLKNVCKRANDAGIGVWLFCTEPLGLPVNHPFWKKYPHLAGQKTQIYNYEPEYALCSSQPEVQNYLKDGFVQLFTAIPLSGVILITSSEQVSNCYAHILSNPANYKDPEAFWNRECKCQRCRNRKAVDVISEIITNINSSITKVRPNAKTIAWDWSWNMHCRPPYSAITDKLPRDIIVMADFERGGKITRLQKQRNVEEYSLAYPGPSPRFKKHSAKTTKTHPLFAKLQINTTHELATAVNLPMVVSLYRKIKYLRDNGCSGTMACWNFACEPDTLNVSAVNDLCVRKKIPQEKIWLSELARSYFGKNLNPDDIVRCWYAFHNAMQSYPLSGCKFLYWSPMNYAVAYPLKQQFEGKPMGPSWLGHKWGDRIEDTFGDFSLTEIVKLLQSLQKHWLNAVGLYESALSGSAETATHNEIASAKFAGCCFRSCWNIYRWYQIHKNSRQSAFTTREVSIIKDELENIEPVLSCLNTDPRLGFHQEGQCYMLDAKSVRRKIKDLKQKLGLQK